MMAVWRIFVSTVSVVILVCISRISCIGSLSPDSQSIGTNHKKEDVEYAENPRVQLRHEDRIINDTLTENGRYGNIEVDVYAFKENFSLSLRLNRQLFASSYIEKIIRKSGVVYASINRTDNCYYIGRVQNRDDSTAAVSTCKGIVGHFIIGNFSYHIESRTRRYNGTTTVYRFRENSQSGHGCGTRRNDTHKRLHSNSDERRHKRSFDWPQDGDGRDKVLELYIANDHSQFVNLEQDSTAVFERAKEIANFASSMYQTQSIYFVLVGMEVWTDEEQFPITSSDVDGTLNSWYRYRMTSINPIHYNDNAVLITAVEFDNRVIGKASIGSMCSNEYSGSIIVDVSSSALAAGSTMAHEIGHNFGLEHDDVNYDGTCICPDGNSKCIMSPSANSPPSTNWSDCSLREFAEAFKTGLDICLYDVPETIDDPTISTCGNGIIEAGEQCDCGRSPQTECNSSCCNSATCLLTGSASCASGRCCDKTRCQILPSGRLCRRSSGDCDPPEYCDGDLSTCPVDTYKPDATECSINGDSVYCYSGKCRSHRSQCQLIWGYGTNSSSSICYERFNILGLHYGNCGLKWLPSVTYIPCQQKNAMCGKLLCDTVPGQQLAYYQNYYLQSTATLNQLTCNSVIFDFGLRTQDPGLVPNGASCGIGQMCISQTCVSVTSLQTSCPESCRSDQVCNNP